MIADWANNLKKIKECNKDEQKKGSFRVEGIG
jgi:hypothetical protein